MYQSMVRIMQCSNCKNDNKPNAQFCNKCGTRLLDIPGMVEAKARAIEHGAKHGGNKRKGKLIAFDIAKTINELRGHCENDEDVFSINITLEILAKKIKDEKSIKMIENMCNRIETLHDDPFSKPSDNTKKHIIRICKYMEEAYCAEIIHGDEDGDEGDSDKPVMLGDGNIVATGGAVVDSVVNIRK